MKRYSTVLTAMLIIFITQFSLGQVPDIGYINVTAGNGKVYLAWQLLAGATCQGITIHRSSDGKDFSGIGHIEGVCGDLTKPESYNFIDEDPPLNQRVYYRLELGSGNYSETVYADLTDLGGNSFQVRPNPVTTTSMLYFENDSKDNHQLIISDIGGKIVYQQSTRNDHFIIRAANFSSGVFVFSIFPDDGTEPLSGKIVILR